MQPTLKPTLQVLRMIALSNKTGLSVPMLDDLVPRDRFRSLSCSANTHAAGSNMK